MDSVIIHSKYLSDCAGAILTNAEVAIEEGRIVNVRHNAKNEIEQTSVIDLGHSILLPGLVNAHAHLELTKAQPHVGAHERFTDWIRELVGVTRQWNAETFNSSLRLGIEQSVKAGTTSIGDISRGVTQRSQYSAGKMRVRLFREVIDFNPETADETFESLLSDLQHVQRLPNVHIGLAPHTPYTVSERLLRRCIELAHRRSWRLCIHLAETRAELEFLKRGTGEIREFREEFGIPRDWKPPGVSPVQYLESLGCFEQPVTLIHGNYVEEKDFEIIASSESSVVYCPRSHRYFGHETHPFQEMMNRGICVGIGTDSLASSPSLSVLDEMRFLAAACPDLERTTIIRMATLNGLRALGLPEDEAYLLPGCRADLVGVRLPRVEPLDGLFSDESSINFSMAGGEIVFKTPL